VIDAGDVHAAWAGLLEAEALLHGGRTWLRDGLLLAVTGLPAPQWNPSVAVGLPGPGAADAVEEALGEGATAVLVPALHADAWAPILSAAGLGPPEERRALARELVGALPDAGDLAVEIVSAATLDEHVRVQAEVYGDDPGLLGRWLGPMLGAPHVRLLTGEGRASAMVLLHAPTGLAAILGVGTVPPARGRGLGTAITAAALREAAAMGARGAFLEPTPQAGALYDRLGFLQFPGRLLWKRG
jgi:GNAT superfamily N-acetyltransferase